MRAKRLSRQISFKIRKCRVCGCTWHKACPGGCWWVEKNLCSSCTVISAEAQEGA